ncbi:MAG: Hsp20/alpha crystallin family protein [Cyclobacteriaceae bacterium]
MTLIKYNPNGYKPVTFSSFVDKFFNDDFYGGKTANSFSPSVDLVETDKSFELEFHIPGINKKDIQIELKNDQLTVSGERKFENENSSRNFKSVESHYGTFTRSFYLPDNVNTEKINAEYKDGILKLDLPKDEKKEAKKTIAIK